MDFLRSTFDKDFPKLSAAAFKLSLCRSADDDAISGAFRENVDSQVRFNGNGEGGGGEETKVLESFDCFLRVTLC